MWFRSTGVKSTRDLDPDHFLKGRIFGCVDCGSRNYNQSVSTVLAIRDEVEQMESEPKEKPLKKTPQEAPGRFRRIKIDTYIGMAFSNLIAYFIILTAAATLHAHGKTDINSAAEAAEALKPIAGHLLHCFSAWE